MCTGAKGLLHEHEENRSFPPAIALYRDPIWDGVADPTLIWDRGLSE